MGLMLQFTASPLRKVPYHFRLQTFKTSLFKVFKEEHAQSVAVDKIREFVNQEHPDAPFEDDELYAAIEAMMDENKVMLADQIVFLI